MLNPSGKTFRRKAALAAILTSGIFAAGIALAEDAWVKTDNVDIRAGKGAVYPIVKTVPKGTQLNVIGHEGNWLKVQIDDKTGYVFQSALSPDKVGSGGNLLSDMGANSNASNMSTGAAAKGLSETAETYAAGKSMDPKLLQKLVDYRKNIDPREWEQFTADGKVGPDAPQ